MAGSYRHVIDGQGRLLRNEDFPEMIENLGDAYEAVEEMYGMIWYLARGNASVVWEAMENWREGLATSPGASLDSHPKEADE